MRLVLTVMHGLVVVLPSDHTETATCPRLEGCRRRCRRAGIRTSEVHHEAVGDSCLRLARAPGPSQQTECMQQSTVGEVPQFDRPISATRNKAATVARNGDGPHQLGVPLEGAKECPTGCIPKLSWAPLPQRSCLPSGENMTADDFSSKVRSRRPPFASQSSPTLLAERRRVPSGENATDQTK